MRQHEWHGAEDLERFNANRGSSRAGDALPARKRPEVPSLVRARGRGKRPVSSTRANASLCDPVWAVGLALVPQGRCPGGNESQPEGRWKCGSWDPVGRMKPKGFVASRDDSPQPRGCTPAFEESIRQENRRGCGHGRSPVTKQAINRPPPACATRDWPRGRWLPPRPGRAAALPPPARLSSTCGAARGRPARRPRPCRPAAACSARAPRRGRSHRSAHGPSRR